MSKSLPIVATAAGGNGDIVNDKTGCGFLVKYGDTKAFAEALYKISEDENLRSTFAKNAKEATKDIFNLENVLLQTLDVYKKIMEKK